LTGYIVGKIYGKDWESVVRERIFIPVNMTKTTTDVHAAIATNNYAFPYVKYDGKIVPLPKDINKLITLLCPAGCISSNVIDMSNWMIFQLNMGKIFDHQLVSQANLQITHTPQMTIGEIPIFCIPIFPASFIDSSYDMGWRESSYQGHRLIWHSGGTLGHISFLWLYPYDSIGIFMSATGDSDKLSMLELLIAAFASDLVFEYKPWLNVSTACRFPCDFIPCEPPEQKQKEPIINEPKSTIPLSHYVGTYFNDAYGDFVITLKDNVLSFKYNDIIGTLIPNGKANQFKFLLEGTYELLFDSKHNNYPPITFDVDILERVKSAVVPFFEMNQPPEFFKTKNN